MRIGEYAYYISDIGAQCLGSVLFAIGDNADRLSISTRKLNYYSIY